MARSIMGIAVVLAASTVAMAGPNFDILGTSPVEVTIGSTTDIYIGTNGAGTIGGMELYLQTSIPNFEIVGVKAADIGGLFVTGTNTAVETTVIYPDAGGLLPSAQYAVDFLSTTGDLANAASGALVAKVTIKAVAGTAAGTLGSLTTNTDVSPSNFAKGDVGQDSIGLVAVVPEPMTGLLMIGLLPLIRRRRA
jgi:hypothetical protein